VSHRIRSVVAWALSILLGLAFIATAIMKLMAVPMQVQLFAALGYPTWFMYFTGVCELLGAILIVIPRYAVVGAIIICCVMVGAIASLVLHGLLSMVPPTIVFLALAIAIGYLRDWKLPLRD